MGCGLPLKFSEDSNTTDSDRQERCMSESEVGLCQVIISGDIYSGKPPSSGFSVTKDNTTSSFHPNFISIHQFLCPFCCCLLTFWNILKMDLESLTTNSNYQVMLDWLKSNGGKFDGLRVPVTFPGGETGIAASHALPARKAIMAIPAKCILTVAKCL